MNYLYIALIGIGGIVVLLILNSQFKFVNIGVFNAPKQKSLDSFVKPKNKVQQFFENAIKIGEENTKRLNPIYSKKINNKQILVKVSHPMEGYNREEYGKSDLTKSEIAWLLEKGFDVNIEYGVKGSQPLKLKDYSKYKPQRPTKFFTAHADKKYPPKFYSPREFDEIGRESKPITQMRKERERKRRMEDEKYSKLTFREINKRKAIKKLEILWDDLDQGNLEDMKEFNRKLKQQEKIHGKLTYK